MKLVLVTPAPPGSLRGNRVTAERWARLLGELGHEVSVVERWQGEPCDLLVALHARRSADSVERFRTEHPAVPVVVTLTGTDLYDDLPKDPRVLATLEQADLLIGLHDEVAADLPPELRSRVRVIRQSAEPVTPAPPAGEGFPVCVLAHLRPVKDPLLAARAARLLPPRSRVSVVHAGAALTAEEEQQARREMAENPRYRWLGELPQAQALALLAGSRLLVLTSRLEGGANVVSEAIAQGVPVLSTRISGSVGILGEGYPGLFPVGDAAALAELLSRAETDERFYDGLARRCRALQGELSPAREREAWRDLLAEVAGTTLALK